METNVRSPLGMVEAMLCGRPILTTDVGAIREWISENETGFIAEAATAYSVGNALERAWQARGGLAEMGQRAHQDASSQIDLNPGRSLLGLLLSVTNEKGRTIAACRGVGGAIELKKDSS